MSKSIKEYIEHLSSLKSKSEGRDFSYGRFSVRAKLDTLSFIDGLASYYGQSRADVIENIIEDSLMQIFLSIPEHEKIPVLLEVSQKALDSDLGSDANQNIWLVALKELQSKEPKQ